MGGLTGECNMASYIDMHGEKACTLLGRSPMVGMDHLPITVFVFIDMLYLCIFVRPNALRDDSLHHDTAAVIVKRPCFDPS